MKKYRTLCLVVLAAACGFGSGLLGFFGYGLYSILLFVSFPFVVVGLFLSIMHDVLHEEPVHQAAQLPISEEKPPIQTPRAA
jgi:hypothetical protein